MKHFKRGDRVVPSGAGRTVTWPKTPGTVLRKTGTSSWEVRWDGTHFEDEMGLDELELAPAACPSCGSARLSEPDAKGLVECGACGDWSNPALGAFGAAQPLRLHVPVNDHA
jgi:hypothetical protein